MATRPPDGNAETGSARGRRSSRACQRCRLAKMKCEVGPSDFQCRRCFAMSMACVFTRSRRGRIKGSKNRRTLAKLQIRQQSSLASPQSTGADSHARCSNIGEIPVDSHEMSLSPRQITNEEENLRPREHVQHSARTQVWEVHQSESNSPWNPCNIVLNLDHSRTVQLPTIKHKLLQILGQFPIEDNANDIETRSSEPQDSDPAVLVAGLAKAGCDLDNAQEHSTNNRSALPEISTLSPEEVKLFAKWTPRALQEIRREQTRYYEHGLLSSKCDVAPELDPISQSLVTEEKAKQLFDVYWETIHSQWAILDPSFHTMARVRKRSALLTTVILALASTTLTYIAERRQPQVTEALSLHAHIDRLIWVIFATGARSIEIIQAHILLSRWSLAVQIQSDELRWSRAAMIPRMATEIGLTHHSHHAVGFTHDTDIGETILWNTLRTRMFLVINEHRFSTFSGRISMDLSNFELDDLELEKAISICKEKSTPSPGAMYQLLLFDRDARRRLEQYQPGSACSILFDAELQHIMLYMEKWIEDWCEYNQSIAQKWYLTHEAISCWLLLTLRVARKRFPSNGPPLSRQQKLKKQEHQRLMLNLATRVFQEALSAPCAILTTHRSVIFTVAASIILKLGGRQDLILRTALRMAGEPGEPFVPTFVRDAGNHMLVMLCRNNAQQPAVINNPAQNESGEIAAGIRVNSQSSNIDPASRQGDQRSEAFDPTDCPVPDLDMDVSLMPFFEQHSEHLFPPDFDLNHFLFTPELAQTEHESQSQATLSYVPTHQQDSWTNASDLNGRDASGSRANISQQVQAAASEAMMQGFLPVSTMNSFADATSADDIGSRDMENTQDWRSKRNSLAETSPPYTMRNPMSDSQPERREALLSAVNQLIQVALAMR